MSDPTDHVFSFDAADLSALIDACDQRRLHLMDSLAANPGLRAGTIQRYERLRDSFARARDDV
jgi:integrase